MKSCNLGIIISHTERHLWTNVLLLCVCVCLCVSVCVCVCEREREVDRDRDRQTERQRQTDRQRQSTIELLVSEQVHRCFDFLLSNRSLTLCGWNTSGC